MSPLDGLVVRRNTTAQQIAEALSERIMSGAFRPGDRLRESAIAGTLGVARSTVREAVRVLELGGLVRYEINRGAVVISPTPEKIDALYIARERLETAAVARMPGAEQLASVSQAYDALAAAAALHDRRAIVQADLDFHTTLVSLLGSTRLDDFYTDLTRELGFYLLVLSAEDREFESPEDLLAEHRAILDALRDGDTERALAAVRSHIHTSAQRLKEILAGDTRSPA